MYVHTYFGTSGNDKERCGTRPASEVFPGRSERYVVMGFSIGP